MKELENRHRAKRRGALFWLITAHTGYQSRNRKLSVTRVHFLELDFFVMEKEKLRVG